MKATTIKGLSDLPDAAAEILTEATRRGATIIAFYGAMGAGKTTLIKEICHQLGIDPPEVNSPSPRSNKSPGRYAFPGLNPR